MPGSTPIFGFPYPDPSDLVANYPALGQQLAEDVEDAIYARKILQIVRATDVTARSTTSTVPVDASISVTITPQKNDSAIVIASIFYTFLNNSAANSYGFFRIADSSNNAISGAESAIVGDLTPSGSQPAYLVNMWAYATPATTSAVTYKLRFWASVATTTVELRNNTNTGQMYAIEVSA